MANSLIHQTRSTDFTARYGGEEFAIVTPHTDKKYVSFFAARIVHFVANKDVVINKSIKSHVSISIGIATFGEDTVVKEELVRLADKALYEAKKLGKNRICMFGVKEKGGKR